MGSFAARRSCAVAGAVIIGLGAVSIPADRVALPGLGTHTVQLDTVMTAMTTAIANTAGAVSPTDVSAFASDEVPSAAAVANSIGDGLKTLVGKVTDAIKLTIGLALWPVTFAAVFLQLAELFSGCFVGCEPNSSLPNRYLNWLGMGLFSSPDAAAVPSSSATASAVVTSVSETATGPSATGGVVVPDSSSAASARASSVGDVLTNLAFKVPDAVRKAVGVVLSPVTLMVNLYVLTSLLNTFFGGPYPKGPLFNLANKYLDWVTPTSETAAASPASASAETTSASGETVPPVVSGVAAAQGGPGVVGARASATILPHAKKPARKTQAVTPAVAASDSTVGDRGSESASASPTERTSRSNNGFAGKGSGGQKRAVGAGARADRRG